jgi:hypothetical protein
MDSSFDGTVYEVLYEPLGCGGHPKSLIVIIPLLGFKERRSSFLHVLMLCKSLILHGKYKRKRGKRLAPSPLYFVALDMCLAAGMAPAAF